MIIPSNYKSPIESDRIQKEISYSTQVKKNECGKMNEARSKCGSNEQKKPSLMGWNLIMNAFGICNRLRATATLRKTFEKSESMFPKIRFSERQVIRIQAA
ncbi:hypothetical protein DLM76_05155 [Leptospira yasudae]|nr:hypothetical protein DLM76_05155 [Leptospira yasudae]